MLRCIQFLMGAGLAALASGCVSRDLAVVPPRPDGIHYPAIYAAGMVKPPRDSAGVLCSLAVRRNLTPGEQIYLVEVVAASACTSDQKTAILLELLHNPATNNFTRAKVGQLFPVLDLQRRHAEELAVALAF